jgi:hypothetical protein
MTTHAYHLALAALVDGKNTPEVRGDIRAHVDALKQELRQAKLERDFWKEVRMIRYPKEERGSEQE